MLRQVSDIRRRNQPRIVAAKHFIWFFLALAMFGLVSQPGSSHDELFHASSIWCASGEKSPYCENITVDPVQGPSATTNIDVYVCQKEADTPLICPTDRAGKVSLLTNGGLYPGLFYRVMNLFVGPSYEVSFVLIRLFNAFVISLLLAVASLLLPRRHRTALMLVVISVLSPSGYYLFASLNPSSWTVIGVLVAWLSCHAAIFQKSIGSRERWCIGVLGVVSAVMAVGSRWDALPYLVFAGALTLLSELWSRFARQRLWLIGVMVSVGSVALLLVGRATPLSPVDNLSSLITFSDGQPDNVDFITHFMLHGVPKALEALGEVPSMTGIYLPRLVLLIGFFVLGLMMTSSFNATRPMQSFGVICSAVCVSLVLMAHHAGMDERDPFGPSSRYVLPLLAFAVGWWYLLAPQEFERRVSERMKLVTYLATFSFGLTVFTVAERNVDRQAFGLRFLPEGPDQWWWLWMPIGPNVVMFLAVSFMYLFLKGISVSIFSHDQTNPSTK